jgi:anthranilate phosphoribosyltransferase
MNAKPISSQATQAAYRVRGVEGSETRGTAEAMMPPRVPGTRETGGDIVRSPRENVGALVNSARY